MEILFLVIPMLFLAEQTNEPWRSCERENISCHSTAPTWPHLLCGVVYQEEVFHRVLVLPVLVVLHPEPLHLHLPPALPAPDHLGWGDGGDGADQLEGEVVRGLLTVGVPGCHQGTVWTTGDISDGEHYLADCSTFTMKTQPKALKFPC